MILTKKDVIGGFVFVLLGIILLVYSQYIVVRPNLTEPGGRLFPQITGVGMIICGLGMAFYRKPKEQKNDKPFMAKDELKRLLLFFAVLVIYFYCVKYIGYLLSSAGFCFSIILLLKRNLKVSIALSVIISIAVSLIIYFLFYYGFNIYLPKGELFN